jgi:hypothetical protein
VPADCKLTEGQLTRIFKVCTVNSNVKWQSRFLLKETLLSSIVITKYKEMLSRYSSVITAVRLASHRYIYIWNNIKTYEVRKIPVNFSLVFVKNAGA